MSEERLRRQVYQFLSREEGFDAREFARAVNEHPSLARFLAGLAGEEARPDAGRVIERVMGVLRARRRRRVAFLRVAAVAALLLASGGGWWLAREASSPVVARREAPAPVDSTRARLVLASGEVISLPGLAAGTTIREPGADVTRERSGALAYAGDGGAAGEVAYNTVVVPRGDEFRLTLSDGTGAWLNSGSEARYPVAFPAGERVVRVEGEAYFKVARDTARPFVVLAGGTRVEALGTGFNVNTYRDRGAVAITLVEGSARVTEEASGRSVVLRPGQQARARAGELTVLEVDAAGTIAWIDGQFFFHDMPLEQIARQLERWYDVTIYFREEAPRAYTFTGVIKRYHALAEICSYIEETTSVRFLVNDREVTVCRAR